MLIPAGQHPKAIAIAQALIDGFDRHYSIFRQVSRAAKARFEAGDWHAVQSASKERIRFYDERVDECVARLHEEFHADWLDDDIWQQAKLLFIGMLVNHKQPELAETFFNSVCCKILHRNYFHNDFIFVRPAISTEYIESDPPTYRSYYPRAGGFRRSLRRIVEDFSWDRNFADLDRDIDYVIQTALQHVGGKWPEIEANFQIQVLSSAFYRNKAAYIIGKAVNGGVEYPFAVPVLHDQYGRLCLDTLLLEPRRIAVLFSLNRAYFMVDMASPSGYVGFLRSMLPFKPKAELYTMLGLAKQGKTVFYRDLMHHLRHSRDDFIIAPGIRGLVMLVFTLPSFPYVFKLIKDEIAPTKDVTQEIVRAKYQLVKQHDRVGRMADTLEFSNVALPKARFTEELLTELRTLAPSLLEEDEHEVVIRHLYIERRMEPLNLFLNRATTEQLEMAVADYGNAIRELATANIFPGDMLFKNFGITRYGRVVFYDYDEIEYMTDCNFREIPEAPSPEMEMASEPWYPVARNDVFPEEFARFLLGPSEIRRVFLQHHRDLLNPRFWRSRQDRIRAGHVEDFYPYPHELRFCHLFGQAADSAA
ncbi:bifunctional isocitrate dehydrogenase kinase/phosphatase [Chitinimonas viridis]|uniref:Isocitrate dehydrogenase kinase/phosphatase n=2 Tax=Chitinimonas TaxID=240411 RepID=A0ABT8B6U2_9NEIS|nr:MULTISPECIES: bifunctional isocitrate dehydrogenase kinase/phosphatase [Chitinimonas]MDN3577555.1 bifunctional isocitrate dehydrogenase kinase/phosphatase [Chitinimonas viridis]GLR15096.1 isocitrate dehydrogenase kinase/phosphatase [Chitinimonas prasina]